MAPMSNTGSGCSKRPSSKAAVSEEARRTLRYVESLSEARTMLAGFFSILLDRMFHSLSGASEYSAYATSHDDRDPIDRLHSANRSYPGATAARIRAGSICSAPARIIMKVRREKVECA